MAQNKCNTCLVSAAPIAPLGSACGEDAPEAQPGDFNSVAEDIVCDAPAGRLEGAEAFRGFMELFSKIVTRSELVAAFGDDRTALLMYDTDTVPVRHAPGAECHRVDAGKITHVTIIFDRQPFTEARAAAGPA